MSVGKQQFQLPLRVMECHERSRATPDRERPQLSKGCSQNDRPLTIQPLGAIGSACEEDHMMASTFVALTDLKNLRAAGIAYPSTVHGWRWLIRRRHERGLDDAFRRIVVDPERYRELVRASSNA